MRTCMTTNPCVTFLLICAIKVLDPEQYVQDFLSTQTDRAGVPYGESKSEYFGQYKLIMTKQEVSERVQLILLIT